MTAVTGGVDEVLGADGGYVGTGGGRGEVRMAGRTAGVGGRTVVVAEGEVTTAGVRETGMEAETVRVIMRQQRRGRGAADGIARERGMGIAQADLGGAHVLEPGGAGMEMLSPIGACDAKDRDRKRHHCGD